MMATVGYGFSVSRDYERHATRRPVISREWDHEPTPVPSDAEVATAIAWEHANNIDRRLSKRISDVSQIIAGVSKGVNDLKAEVHSLSAHAEADEKRRDEEVKMQLDARVTMRWIVGIVITSAVALAASSIGSCIQSERRMTAIETRMQTIHEQLAQLAHKLEKVNP